MEFSNETKTEGRTHEGQKSHQGKHKEQIPEIKHSHEGNHHCPTVCCRVGFQAPPFEAVAVVKGEFKNLRY